MEFNEKLQELRKQKGLTQDELAQFLYVSRTAISKWESGRGYPNIDSLKGIATFFGVTVDELLSGEELLVLAETDKKQEETCLRDLVFGLLDCSGAMFFVLPFFGQRTDGILQAVSLLNLADVAPYLKAAYFVVVISTVLLGLSTLVLQNCHWIVLERSKCKLSLGLNAVGVLLFVISLQPYAAVFLLVCLAIKTALLLKKR